MKKLTLFGIIHFFIVIAWAQNLHVNTSGTFAITDHDKKPSPQQADYVLKSGFAIVITVPEGTNDLGCNPSAATIDAGLGVASAASDCGNVTLTSSDGTVISSSPCDRSQTRTWTATDVCGGLVTASRTVVWKEDVTTPVITVSPTNPALGCNPTNAEIDAAFGNAFVSDLCPGQAAVSTGPIISFACARSQTITWTATDACGHMASASRTVTWTVDLHFPEIGPTPNITVTTDAGLPTATVSIVPPTASDDCAGELQPNVARSDNLPLSAPYPLGTTTLAWSATDACARTSVQHQTITVIDAEAPLINSCPSVSPQCFNSNSFYSIPTLTATDNAGDISLGYEITGATARKGSTGDASGLFNPGFNNILWTVMDASGNTSTCATPVMIDKIDASIPDAYAENISPDIGSTNTIYIGYGGKSITLASNITNSINSAFYSYKWTIGSPGGVKIGTGPTVSVNLTTTTTYYLSIKDENGCSQTTQVSKQVNVTDIRCGSDKVFICEMQKNGSVKTNCIPVSKVSSISPGSRLGLCPNLVTRSVIKQDSKGMQACCAF